MGRRTREDVDHGKTRSTDCTTSCNRQGQFEGGDDGRCESRTHTCYASCFAFLRQETARGRERIPEKIRMGLGMDLEIKARSERPARAGHLSVEPNQSRGAVGGGLGRNSRADLFRSVNASLAIFFFGLR